MSVAGREKMIKSVAQAVPTYAMSCFKLQDSICKEIDSGIAHFWWGGNDRDQKIHWKSWRSTCASKHYGGMGFRDTRSYNLAMLAKQEWRLQLKEPTLAYKVLKARYFPKGEFMELMFVTVEDWFREIQNRVTKDELEDVVGIMWALWKARNLLIFKNQHLDPLAVINLGQGMVL